MGGMGHPTPTSTHLYHSNLHTKYRKCLFSYFLTWSPWPTNGRTDGQMDRQTDGRTDRWTDGWTNIASYRAACQQLKMSLIKKVWQTNRPRDGETNGCRVACTRQKIPRPNICFTHYCRKNGNPKSPTWNSLKPHAKRYFTSALNYQGEGNGGRGVTILSTGRFIGLIFCISN